MRTPLGHRWVWGNSLRGVVVGCILVLGLSLVPVSPVAGQEGQFSSTTESRIVAKEAIDKLWSPYCPGFMLEICTSSQGAALRDSIHTMAREGSSSDEIVEWVLGNHGEGYLAVPRAEGGGLVVWLMPAFALLFGVGVVVVVMRRLRRIHPAVEDPGPARQFTEEEDALIRAALQELEASEEPAI